MCKIIVLVLLSILVVVHCHSRVLRDTKDINDIVDELLQELKTEVLQGGIDQIAIPDLEKDFKKKWHFIHLSGSFTATKGWFKSLSSVQRTGSTTVTSTPDTLKLQIMVGLSDMEVGYDHYRVKFGHISQSGGLRAKVKHNSVDCKISLTVGDKCVASGSAALNEFSGIKIHVTGLGPLNWILSKISSWVAEHYRNKIKDKASSKLNESFSKALIKYDICSKIFH